jgi:hypothetical protein
MGCGTSMNTVVPLHYIENQNGSALWNNTPGSDVLDYMTAQDMKQADIRAKQVTLDGVLNNWQTSGQSIALLFINRVVASG